MYEFSFRRGLPDIPCGRAFKRFLARGLPRRHSGYQTKIRPRVAAGRGRKQAAWYEVDEGRRPKAIQRDYLPISPL
jgi:hypothetical protein